MAGRLRLLVGAVAGRVKALVGTGWEVALRTMSRAMRATGYRNLLDAAIMPG